MKIVPASSYTHKVTRYGAHAAGYVVTFIMAVPLIVACMFAGWVFQFSEHVVHRRKMKKRQERISGATAHWL